MLKYNVQAPHYKTVVEMMEFDFDVRCKKFGCNLAKYGKLKTRLSVRMEPLDTSSTQSFKLELRTLIRTGGNLVSDDKNTPKKCPLVGRCCGCITLGCSVAQFPHKSSFRQLSFRKAFIQRWKKNTTWWRFAFWPLAVNLTVSAAFISESAFSDDTVLNLPV